MRFSVSLALITLGLVDSAPTIAASPEEMRESRNVIQEELIRLLAQKDLPKAQSNLVKIAEFRGQVLPLIKESGELIVEINGKKVLAGFFVESQLQQPELNPEEETKILARNMDGAEARENYNAWKQKMKSFFETVDREKPEILLLSEMPINPKDWEFLKQFQERGYNLYSTTLTVMGADLYLSNLIAIKGNSRNIKPSLAIPPEGLSYPLSVNPSSADMQKNTDKIEPLIYNRPIIEIETDQLIAFMPQYTSAFLSEEERRNVDKQIIDIYQNLEQKAKDLNKKLVIRERCLKDR